MSSQDSINALLALHLAKTLKAEEHNSDTMVRGRSRSFASQDELGLGIGGASKLNAVETIVKPLVIPHNNRDVIGLWP